jgi:signal peptidase II
MEGAWTLGLSLRALGVLTAAACFAADQASKLWLLHSYGLADRNLLPLTPFLDLTLAWNKGVSYSLFRADARTGQLALVGLALVAMLILGFWMWRAQNRVAALSLAMVLGGAAGNALDRAMYGAVMDFLHFHTPFPAGPFANYIFNLADVFITLGVVGLIFDSFFGRDRVKENG